MRRLSAPLLVAAVAIALSACATPVSDTPSASAEPTRPVASAPDLETPPRSDDPVTGEVPAEIMADILADAAARSGEEPDAIDVTQAAFVVWNDGSLGCPEPGMSYTMALVDGYHVILDAAGEELDYRVTEQGTFMLCENGGRPSGG